MVAIPVTLGSRSRIRVQQAWRRPCALAATTYRDQEGTVDVRHVRDTEILWRVRHRLRAGPGSCEREVRRMATRYPQPLRCQAGECHEGDAFTDSQGKERARAPVYRRSGRGTSSVRIDGFTRLVIIPYPLHWLGFQMLFSLSFHDRVTTHRYHTLCMYTHIHLAFTSLGIRTGSSMLK